MPRLFLLHQIHTKRSTAGVNVNVVSAHLRNGERRAPLFLEDVEANAALAIHVGMVHLRLEVHLGRLEGVVGRKLNGRPVTGEGKGGRGERKTSARRRRRVQDRKGGTEQRNTCEKMKWAMTAALTQAPASERDLAGGAQKIIVEASEKEGNEWKNGEGGETQGRDPRSLVVTKVQGARGVSTADVGGAR